MFLGVPLSSYFPFGKGYPRPHLPSPIHTEVQASLPRPPAHVDFQFSSASDYRGSHPTLHPHWHLSAGQSVSDSFRVGPDHITGSLRPAVAPHSPRQSVGSFADFGCLLSVVCHGQPLGPQLTSAAIFRLCLPDSCQIQCVPSQHPLGKFCTLVSLNPQLLGSLPH